MDQGGHLNSGRTRGDVRAGCHSADQFGAGHGPQGEEFIKHQDIGDDRLDLRVFVPSILALAGVIVALILFPESGSAMVQSAFAFATGKFGWFYLVVGLATVVFLGV